MGEDYEGLKAMVERAEKLAEEFGENSKDLREAVNEATYPEKVGGLEGDIIDQILQEETEGRIMKYPLGELVEDVEPNSDIYIGDIYRDIIEIANGSDRLSYGENPYQNGFVKVTREAREELQESF